MHLHTNKKDFRELIIATASNTPGLQNHQVEKDYYVSLFLKELSKLENNVDIVFKGGTSLSKCYDVIDRFSEDIDLTIKFPNVKAEEETKNEVEDILDILGINMSTAVDLFLNQIILNKGLPFKVKLPSKDITVKEQELAEALNLTAGKPYPKKFKKIINLYARGEIDYDVALYAIKKTYEKDRLKDISDDLLEEYEAAYKKTS